MPRNRCNYMSQNCDYNPNMKGRGSKSPTYFWRRDRGEGARPYRRIKPGRKGKKGDGGSLHKKSRDTGEFLESLAWWGVSAVFMEEGLAIPQGLLFLPQHQRKGPFRPPFVKPRCACCQAGRPHLIYPRHQTCRSVPRESEKGRRIRGRPWGSEKGQQQSRGQHQHWEGATSPQWVEWTLQDVADLETCCWHSMSEGCPQHEETPSARSFGWNTSDGSWEGRRYRARVAFPTGSHQWTM